VYQLVTRDSIEERLLQRAKMKLALEHLVVAKMDKQLTSNELTDILRFGASHLFDDQQSADNIDYDSTAIEKLLDRSQAKYDEVSASAH